MVGDKKILIVGGDERQKLLYNILKNKGYKCLYENSDADRAIDELYTAKLIVLPVPVSDNGEYIYSYNNNFKLKMKEFISEIDTDQLVLGGAFKREAVDIFHENQVIFRDMLKFEHFVKYNAYLTSQGAVKLLLDNTQKLITGEKVLITGFGRVAFALAETLRAMKADVFIAARSLEQITQAACLGYKTLDVRRLSQVVYLFDYIFNTVPEKIFNEKDIGHFREDCIYFELASKPYGANPELFVKNSKIHVMGNSLPGRYVPLSAAMKIYEFVETMI